MHFESAVKQVRAALWFQCSHEINISKCLNQLYAKSNCCKLNCDIIKFIKVMQSHMVHYDVLHYHVLTNVRVCHNTVTASSDWQRN